MAQRHRFSAFPAVVGLAALTSLLLAGCGGALPSPSATVTQGHADARMQGKVHGGQQPVAGAMVQLYAVGSTGDASASTALLTVPAITDANGNFSFAGFTCPASNPLVYLTATGGNPGLPVGTTVPYNSALAMMSVIGNCSSITTSTFVSINELTTVAAIFPLAPFATSASAIGSSSGDAGALAAAFQTAEAFVNSSTGQTPGPMLTSGSADPIAELDLLANILAACVNTSGGVAGDNSNCGKLFTDTPSLAGTSPTDTITAFIHAARNPTANISNLFALSSGVSPFQPQPAVPPSDITPRIGTPGLLTVSPSTLNFPDTQQNITSAPLTITLTNNSSSPAAAVPSVTNASGFAVTSQCGEELDPGFSCTALVTFTPSAAGIQTSQIVVSGSSLPGSPAVFVEGNGIAATPGNVSLSATSITAAGPLVLRNYSPYPVTINSISFGGNYPNVFTQTNNCPTEMPAASTCTINIAVAPGSNVYTYTATLTVVDSAATSPQTASLSVFVENNQTVAQMNFGTVAVGSSLSVGVTSVGAQTNAIVSGTNAADFFVVQPPPSCTFVYQLSYYACSDNITFHPLVAGPLTASLQLAGGGSLPAIPLTGTGGTPAASFSLSTTIGPNGRAVTVTNTGNTLATYTAALAGAHPEAYYLFNSPLTCSFVLAGSVPVCVFNVGDYAQAARPSPATLVVTDSISGVQQTLTLSQLSYPSPALSAPSTHFPATHLGATSAPIVFSITPPYGDPGYFTVTGSSFSISGPSTCQRNAATCTVSVVYSPTAAETIEYGSVGFTDQVVTSYVATSLGIDGVGGIPAYSATPTSYNFGSQQLGSTTSTIVTLKDTGDGYGTCPTLSIGGAAAADYTITNSTGTLSPGATCTAKIVFSPSGLGSRVAIASSTSASVSVSLTGSGTY